jgi:nucleoside-diphosphate-sugar epimerase
MLLLRGHRVTALVHKASDAARFGKVERVIVGDVTRRETFEGAAKDADAIVHLALPDVQTRHRVAYPVWIQGTRNLLAVATERGMRAFAHASGCVATYRHAPGAWVDETAPVELTTRLTQGRGETVAMVHEAQREHGLSVAVLRPPLVYGRGGAFQKFFVDYMRTGKYRVIGDGSNYTGFVHVQDCALAYALAVEKAKGAEEYIVADDEPMTLRAASDLIADAVGAKRPGSAPPFLASLVVGRDAVRLLTESLRARNAKLKERLGWTPTYPTLRDGLPSVVG